MTFFNAWINNRKTAADRFRVIAQTPNGEALPLKGQTEALSLPGGENRKIDYALVSPHSDQAFTVNFFLLDQQQQVVARAQAQVLPTFSD